MNKCINRIIPGYKGQEWLQARLPVCPQNWVEGKGKSLRQRNSSHKDTCRRLAGMIGNNDWHWPRKPVYFITDVHADADAFVASLVASGCVRKTGAADNEFRLRKAARLGRFVIGGDCFDKGPDNLRLLRMLKRLKKRGADMRLLAGNHDVRVMLGMRSVGRFRDRDNEHFFVRMGPKAIPLITEITQQYVGRAFLKQMPSNKKCRRLLYPSGQWFEQFPTYAHGVLSKCAIERELVKISKKIEQLEHRCEVSGLSMKQVYAAALKWQELFLKPGGEFYWFYDGVRLFHRQGSFLFTHAGIDDQVSGLIKLKGVKHVNKRFRKQLNGNELSFYYGPIANVIRTKYRAGDYHLTQKGARLAHDSGVHVIIHGHRNVYNGQRISLRKNMINFECDTTMDSGSRSREGLKGAGAGVTIVHPEKVILGISSDHDYIKVFDSSAVGDGSGE